MFLVLGLLACDLFGARDPATDSERPSEDSAGGADSAGGDSKGTQGSAVRFVTTRLDVTSGVDVAAPAPDNGTFVRVDSCEDNDGAGACDIWAGGYSSYDDGRLVLEPSTWDGPVARVTWLVIE